MTQPVEGSKTFPILLQPKDRRENRACNLLPKGIPWAMIDTETSRRRAVSNHSQTLERLAERGGLDPVEMIAVLDGVAFPWERSRADPSGILTASAEELLRRVATYRRAVRGELEAVAVTRSWSWECSVCRSANAAPDPAPPVSACSFCRTPVRLSIPEGDAPTPRGAGDPTDAHHAHIEAGPDQAEGTGGSGRPTP